MVGMEVHRDQRIGQWRGYCSCSVSSEVWLEVWMNRFGSRRRMSRQIDSVGEPRETWRLNPPENQ
jgi:hypothetical protein